jgi:hypothetical protein
LPRAFDAKAETPTTARDDEADAKRGRIVPGIVAPSAMAGRRQGLAELDDEGSVAVEGFQGEEA